ncbi:hypothetical protein [Serratia fonticola]|uniref:hypothetical protein n=1 Tax=Serratia fonticola TaxID=47917 RepID=UPI0014154400|nr:hypothetical protein [Serratia fonticola]QIP93127.1 hypothetical protein HAP32_03647 [Serratia fonticola]
MNYDDAWMYKLHAAKAVQGIERDGCYWFIATRPAYGVVPNLLREVGYSVITFNPPPVYEYAVYLSDNHPDTEEIEKIARLREEMRDKGESEDKLPTSL